MSGLFKKKNIYGSGVKYIYVFIKSQFLKPLFVCLAATFAFVLSEVLSGNSAIGYRQERMYRKWE